MEELVDLVIEDERWEAFGLERLAHEAVAASCAYLGLSGVSCVILACDDARIAALNAEFRGKPVPTNVLSWPSQDRAAEVEGALPEAPEQDDEEDDPLELGDIAIAYDTCAREAEAAGKPMADHVTHLLVHGLLHLLGYDHVREGDATLMETSEGRILAQMGLCDPYSP